MHHPRVRRPGDRTALNGHGPLRRVTWIRPVDGPRSDGPSSQATNAVPGGMLPETN